MAEPKKYTAYQQVGASEDFLESLLQSKSTKENILSRLLGFKQKKVGEFEEDLETIEKKAPKGSGSFLRSFVLGLINPYLAVADATISTAKDLTKTTKYSKDTIKYMEKKYGKKGMGFLKDIFKDSDIVENLKKAQLSGGKILGKSAMAGTTSYLMSKLFELPEFQAPGTVTSPTFDPTPASVPTGSKFTGKPLTTKIDVTGDLIKSIQKGIGEGGGLTGSKFTGKPFTTKIDVTGDLIKSIQSSFSKPLPQTPGNIGFKSGQIAPLTLEGLPQQIKQQGLWMKPDISALYKASNIGTKIAPGYIEQLFKHYSPSALKRRATGLEEQYKKPMKAFGAFSKFFGSL